MKKMNFTITFRYKIPIFTIKSSNIKTKTISVSATSSLKYGFSTVSFLPIFGSQWLGESEQTFRYNGCLTVMNGIRDGQQLAKMKTGFSDFVGPEITFCISDLEAYALIIFSFLYPNLSNKLAHLLKNSVDVNVNRKNAKKH